MYIHIYICIWWWWFVALAAVAKPEQAAFELRSQPARCTHPRHKRFDRSANFNTLCIAPLAQASALGLAPPQNSGLPDLLPALAEGQFEHTVYRPYHPSAEASGIASRRKSLWFVFSDSFGFF